MRLRGRVLILCFVYLDLARAVAAADWPQNYVVHENSESPDGRYGVLVASMDAWEKDETLEETNYLADLKRHQLLGKIKSADYFAHQNHRGLKTVWAPDSSWCVVEYDGRFGFDTISILEPKDSKFIQTDIGKRVDEMLASAIRKRSHGRDNSDDTGGGDATTYFRIDANGKLQVRAVSTTDPKQLDPKNCRSALFYGTFDVPSKKWLSAETRSLTSEEYEGAGSAFGDIDSEVGATTFVREEDNTSTR